MEAPWTPAPLVPSLNPAVRAAGAAARAEASNGWGGSLPSIGGGGGAQRCRWLGTFFALFLCGRAPVCRSCPSGVHRGMIKRSKSGRSPSPRSGEAGGRVHCYRPGSNRRSMRRQPTMVTTMPLCLPYHVVQYKDTAGGFFPCPPSCALCPPPPPHRVPLSLAPSLSHKWGARDVQCVSIPPGVRTHLHKTEEVPNTRCTMTSCYLHSGLCILYLTAALPHASPLRRLGLSNRKRARNASYSSTKGSSPQSEDCSNPPPLLVLRYCYH